jgi:hypothetical protein
MPLCNLPLLLLLILLKFIYAKLRFRFINSKFFVSTTSDYLFKEDLLRVLRSGLWPMLIFGCNVDSVLFSNTFRFPIDLNGFWIRALPGLMHLRLRRDPLCLLFCTKLEEPFSFSKVPDGPYI